MQHYDILGISHSANSEAIQKAYRQKAVKFHPDKTRDVYSVIEFGKIAEAYDVLINPEWRALYDLYGLDVLKNGRETEDGGRIGGCYQFDAAKDAMRVFTQAFGTENSYEAIYSQGLQDACGDLKSYQPPKYSPDKRIEFYCDLEEVFYGCEKTVIHTQSIQDSESTQREQSTEIRIRIAPGEAEGTEYLFPGERDVKVGMQPGNVIYQLHIQPHPQFSREGRNLIRSVQIPIHQAFLNQPIEVETIDKKKLAFVLPCIPTPGYRHVIQGEGMQYPDRTRGDLIVELSFLFQKQLTQLQKSLIQSAFLFPSDPTAAQMEAAKAFDRGAKHVQQGWLTKG